MKYKNVSANVMNVGFKTLAWFFAAGFFICVGGAIETFLSAQETTEIVSKVGGNPVVCVKWEDATGYAETWITVEEIAELEPAIATSCGVLVYEDEKRVWLAMDHDGEGYYAGISSIPKSWVLETSDADVSLISMPVTGGKQRRPASKEPNAYAASERSLGNRVADLEKILFEDIEAIRKEAEASYKLQTTVIRKLEQRIVTLEAQLETTDTVLEGLPALGDLLAQHETEFEAWRVNAEGVMELTNAQVQTFQEQLDVEIEFRNNLTPDDDWAWKRQFSISMHEHGLLQADHWSICRSRILSGRGAIRGRSQ